MSLFAVDDLAIAFGGIRAVDGVSFAVEDGEVFTVIGPNGAGKTTMFNLISRIYDPDSGRITFDGAPIDGLPSHRIARAGIGLVPEGRQVFPNLSVRENLVATRSNRSGREDGWTVEKIYAMFPELEARRASMGNMLSGGEQQMLAIGRALMTNPRLLILDEATEGLAPLVRKEIWACLRRLKEAGQAILVIDKNVDDMVRIADRHHIIEKGCIAWSGSSRELLGDKRVMDRYLGV